MHISDFYRFRSKLLMSTFQAHPSGQITLNNDYPFDHHLIMGDYTGISFPVIFQQEYGKKLCDILDTGFPSLYLISEKMKTVLEVNCLTGWKTYSIKLLDKKDNEISGYHGFSVIGRCGPVDYNKCEVFEKKWDSGYVDKIYKGLYVGLDRWDESDFFLPQDYYGLIVSDLACRVLKDNKLTNIELENLSDFETPENNLK